MSLYNLSRPFLSTCESIIMLISVSRLLMVSSFNLLFGLSLTQIPRIFVLDIVKALSVFGNGDSINPLIKVDDWNRHHTIGYPNIIVAPIIISLYFYLFLCILVLFCFLPMRARFVSLRHHMQWLVVCDRVRKVDSDFPHTR